MHLRGVHLNDFDWALLERCSAEQVEESRTLDFKRERPDLDSARERPKRDLCEDICSFANTGGGVLLFGIDEQVDEQGRRGSRMGQIVGVPLDDFDHYRDRLYEIVRAAMEPRFDQFLVRDVRRVARDRDGVIAVGIERSIRFPHRVKAYDSFQFMNRTMRSAEAMDVGQISDAFRRSFESTQDAAERLTRAEERMRQPPRTFYERTVTLAATIIPASRDALPFPIRHERVLEALETQRDTRRNINAGTVGYDERGAVLRSQDRTVPLDRVSGDGSLERIDLIPTNAPATPARLDEVRLARSLFRAFAAFRQIREILGIVGPSLVSFGLIGAGGYTLYQVEPPAREGGAWMFPQEEAYELPAGDLFTRADTSEDTFGVTLKEIADFFWQAAGHRQCAAFDDEGNPTEAFRQD